MIEELASETCIRSYMKPVATLAILTVLTPAAAAPIPAVKSAQCPPGHMVSGGTARPCFAWRRQWSRRSGNAGAEGRRAAPATALKCDSGSSPRPCLPDFRWQHENAPEDFLESLESWRSHHDNENAFGPRRRFARRRTRRRQEYIRDTAAVLEVGSSGPMTEFKLHICRYDRPYRQ